VTLWEIKETNACEQRKQLALYLTSNHDYITKDRIVERINKRSKKLERYEVRKL
jgi:hypothetical protein